MKITRLQKIVIIVLCLAIAGPELALGLEFMAIVQTFGVELVLLYFSVQLWGHWFFIKSKIEKFDPYFFSHQ